MAEEKKDMLVEVIKYMRENPDPNPPKPEAIGLKRINAKPVKHDPKRMQIRTTSPITGVSG